MKDKASKRRQVVATSVRAWSENRVDDFRAPKVRQKSRPVSVLRTLVGWWRLLLRALTDAAISLWPFGPGFVVLISSCSPVNPYMLGLKNFLDNPPRFMLNIRRALVIRRGCEHFGGKRTMEAKARLNYITASQILFNTRRSR
jgi:hypothetical protein